MRVEAIVNNASVYVRKLLESRLAPTMYFHNLAHTTDVYNATKEICKHTDGIDQNAYTTVLLAAIFHDAGYAYQYLGHEDISMAIAGTYLIGKGYHRGMYQPVLDCIKATKVPQSPQNLTEQILCDADFHHFANPNYLHYADLLRKEWETHLRRTYSDEDWLRLNINVLGNHSYFTDYGKIVMQSVKQQNIDLMRNSG